ncbi:MAG: chromosome segregation protein [Planctomycetes bacterium]|nr:chromosome segregation protein [Planctomycetota bacterium]
MSSSSPLRTPLAAHLSILFSCAVLVAGLGTFSTSPGPEGAEQRVSFNRDVRPLLADRCFHCHGPDEHDRKGKLRLDRADGPEGAYRVRGGKPAIKPGSLEASAVWYRLTTDDEDDAMPPAGSHKESLTTEQRDIIRRWILQGAEYEDHWAFVAPARPADVKVANPRWSSQPIDRFVMWRLEASHLSPSARAGKRALIRRLSLDLTGLPPTLGEIRAFLASDNPADYERLVDRLLAKPQYGEHMAKYWLDLVRFADTNGIHHDHFRDMTPYRDWVTRSWNANLPYDQFVTDQLAGDLHPDPTEDQLTASGFNRLHMIIDRGTALPAESFARNVIDRVTAVGTAFMGLTVQCAVCHDHKHDPLKQADFYRLFAFFNNLDARPETGGRGGADFKRGLQPPYISFPTARQSTTLEELRAKVSARGSQVKRLKSGLGKAPDGEPKRELAKKLKEAQEDLKTLKRKQVEIQGSIRAAMVMKERAEVRPAYVLIRGDYQTPGERVERGTPSFLPPMKQKGDTKTRMGFAEWLVSREHPLTARVAVNRFWQQLFGVGLVKTAENFGAQGEWPTHPDLLDHLAVSFVESGWDVKALIKQIVMSATYQQSSAARPEIFEKDPENRLMARGSRFRMDSEMIRDQILATSGLLNSTMYGKSVKPPQPPGIWKAVTLPSSYPRTYSPDHGDKIYRRSVYTFWKRGMPPPQMSILNAPTRESCIARRERTNTPLQALLLMNETEYLKAARHLAASTLVDARSEKDRLNLIYETITSRVPDPVESKALLELVREMEAMYGRNPALAEQLCEGIKLRDGQSGSELAAWTMLVSTVYNLDITKTRE